MNLKFLWAIGAGLTFAALAIGVAIGKDQGTDKNFNYAIGLWGDLPCVPSDEADAAVRHRE
jgi:hypothetical protein